MHEWMSDLGSGMRWALVVLLAGGGAALVLLAIGLVLLALGVAVQLPSFQLGIGPLRIYDWVFDIGLGADGR